MWAHRELIADGKIKLKSGVTIAQINAHSVVLSDGTELPADLIVYATGYGSMNGWAAKIYLARKSPTKSASAGG